MSAFPAPERTDAWCYKTAQKPVAGEVIDPGEETSTIVLLNGHAVSIKLNSKYLRLQISVAQSLGRKVSEKQ